MESAFFLAPVIIALTQMVKMAIPEQVHGWITILIALVMGVVVAVFATPIGLVETTVAEGIVAALAAIGISTAFDKSSDRGARGDA